ncbi:MAG: NCS2 family permease [Lachnospiraceae bacterium]
MEKLFQLKKHNTNVRTEVIGGLTTFFAMAYIIFVNPNFLSQTGMDHTAVMLATCISAAIGCFLTAFMANVPFAQAPGMGLNAFFTYTICFGMGYTWQQGLAIVFISGLIFLAISVSPIRKQIIDSIPAPLKAAISAGIGLFICLIGLLNAGIVTAGNNLLDLSSITSGPALLALIGLIITGILMAWKVKGALFIGILVTTVIGIPMGVTNLSNVSISFEGISIAPTFFKLSFVGLLSKGILPLLTAVVTFAMCDCFDTVGTLIGTAGSAGMLDENGNLPRGDKALIADAMATCTGALMGTSTVTTFVESSTGISEGARTGLSSVVVGILFLLGCVLAPIAGIILRRYRPRADHRRHVHDRQRGQDRLERRGSGAALLPDHRHDALRLLHLRWYRLRLHFLHPDQDGPRQVQGCARAAVHSVRPVRGHAIFLLHFDPKCAIMNGGVPSAPPFDLF